MCVLFAKLRTETKENRIKDTMLCQLKAVLKQQPASYFIRVWYQVFEEPHSTFCRPSHFVEKEEEPLAAEGNDSTSKEGLPTLDSNGLLAEPGTEKSYKLCCKQAGLKAGTGVGRSNNDRQFVFINQRPVDIPKLTRTMNSVWRLHEMKHKPAYILT